MIVFKSATANICIQVIKTTLILFKNTTAELLFITAVKNIYNLLLQNSVLCSLLSEVRSTSATNEEKLI